MVQVSIMTVSWTKKVQTERFSPNMHSGNITGENYDKPFLQHATGVLSSFFYSSSSFSCFSHLDPSKVNFNRNALFCRLESNPKRSLLKLT